jgi:hypothetical protein
MAYTTIDDPSAHFQAETYTGAGANTSVTFSGNSDLKPDFLWLKNRTAGYAHAAFDSNRNLGSAVNAPFLEPNDVSVENDNQNWWNSTNNGINTDGFQFGSVSEHNLNNLNSEYVAWAWKANGGTTSTNNDGAVTSTVQLNSDAGFSILTYTMNSGSNETVGHGLGEKPDIIIYKARERGDVNGVWLVYTTLLDGSLDYLRLNDTNAKSDSVLASPTTTTFIGGGSSTEAYRHFVAYCFKSIQGYSKFGKYVGNGNSNGPFVYTGFKPAFVLIKNVDTTQVWIMYDGARKPFNRDDNVASFYANTAGAEYTGASYHNLDILSNGFKIRLTDASQNGNGNNHIYMAFAENPFTTSTGVPTTAR